MKQLKDIILERLKLTSKTKLNHYICQPKNKSELREIIETRLSKDPNADLNDIDVSNITSMSSLFEGLDPHNIKIDQWNVSNVTNMGSMFWDCVNLNVDLNNWNVSNVEDMSFMFDNCKNFDSDLSNWNVDNLKLIEYMFHGCEKFKGTGLKYWHPTKIDTLESTFSECYEFNGDLSNWDVSNVMNMNNAFKRCKVFEGKGLEKWNVTKAIAVQQTFAYCYKFHADLNSWKPTELFPRNKAHFTFQDCTSLSQLPKWYKD